MPLNEAGLLQYSANQKRVTAQRVGRSFPGGVLMNRYLMCSLGFVPVCTLARHVVTNHTKVLSNHSSTMSLSNKLGIQDVDLKEKRVFIR
jgi:hypothetical protein